MTLFFFFTQYKVENQLGSKNHQTLTHSYTHIHTLASKKNICSHVMRVLGWQQSLRLNVGRQCMEKANWYQGGWLGGPALWLGLTVAHGDVLLTDLCRGRQCVGGRGFVYANGVSLGNERGVMGGTRSVGLVAASTLAVGRGLQIVLSRDGFIWRWHVQVGEGRSWWQGCGGLFYRQVVLNTIPTGPDRGLTLSLTHLMKVGPSSNNDYLSIAWVAQVCCQLPLSWSVPAHIEEYLNNDEYNNNYVPVQLHVCEMSISEWRLS